MRTCTCLFFIQTVDTGIIYILNSLCISRRDKDCLCIYRAVTNGYTTVHTVEKRRLVYRTAQEGMNSFNDYEYLEKLNSLAHVVMLYTKGSHDCSVSQSC
jgi:hypothetical protein